MAVSNLAAAGAANIIFAYAVLLRLPKGAPRVLATLPWILLLAPLAWSTPTVHLRALVSFVFLWMMPFKLLLACWDRGPISDPAVRSSFLRFFAAVGMTLHVPSSSAGNSAPANPATGHFASPSAASASPVQLHSERWTTVLARAAFKFFLVASLFLVYAARDNLPDAVLFLVFSIHIYLACGLVFEALAAPAGAIFGMELEPFFDKPFLASSVSEFWGRRWNRLVGSMLRASIYEPVMAAAGSRKLWVRASATIAAFLVSGIMHELIFSFMNRAAPTGEALAFFIVQGVATVVEVTARKKFGVLAIPKPLAVLLTLSFIYITACWLFFPPIHRPGTCFQALAEFEHFLVWARRIKP